GGVLYDDRLRRARRVDLLPAEVHRVGVVLTGAGDSRAPRYRDHPGDQQNRLGDDDHGGPPGTPDPPRTEHHRTPVTSRLRIASAAATRYTANTPKEWRWTSRIVTAIAAVPVTAAAAMPARNGTANPGASPLATTPRPL